MSRARPLLALLILAGLLAGLLPGALVAREIIPAEEFPTDRVVVRLYFDSRAQLDAIAAQYDVWEVHFDAPAGAERDSGYAVVQLLAADYAHLRGQGYRLEIDPDKTALLGIDAPLDARYYYFDENYTNPNGLYMVEFLQTMSNTYPDLVELIDIGNAWQGENGGYNRDLWVLRITNEDPAYGPIADKPTFVLHADIHAREVTTPEMAIRYIKHLLEGYRGQGGYGIDPDVTWLVDWNVAYIMVTANPDGHRVNEANTGASRRKNMNNTLCGGGNFGIDLNRNHNFRWGCCGGSSGNSCEETYRGVSRSSEPETFYFQNWITANNILRDQNGPNDWNTIPPAAPLTATGVLLSLHTYADMVLWPWGFTSNPAPNSAQLIKGGRKLGYYTGYEASDGFIYVVDGDTHDWSYGQLGVASFGFEIGPNSGSCGGFFPAYGCQDGIDGMSRDFWSENQPAYTYLHKIARTPYLTAYGPDAQDLAASPGAVPEGAPIDLSALIQDHRCCGDTPVNIAGAEYFIDEPGADGTGFAMTPQDGSWGGAAETALAAVNTSGLSAGRHYLLVHGRSAADNRWGPFTAIFFYIVEPGVSPTLEGYVRDASNNLPLVATVAAGGFQTTSDPATGYYSMVVISGTYDMSAVAAGHAISTVTGIAAQNYQTVQQDFYLSPICEIWADDVEGGNLGWTPAGSWAITTEASHSPAHSWTDSPGANYGNNWNYAVESPVWDMSGYTGISLDFWHTYATEAGYDHCYVEVSTNGGSTWTQVASYNGTQTSWVQATWPLSALDNQANARLRFRLYSDTWTRADGWHIDDIVLTGGGPACITPLAPTADFASNSPVSLGEPVVFTNQTVGTVPMAYLWHFGDGNTSPLEHPTHTYALVGTYTVTLEATNAYGTDSVSHPVEVLPVVCVPLTGVTIAGDTAGEPGVYTFTTSIEPAGATPPIDYLWDNGDTTGWTVRDLDVGSYTLLVTATNCTDTVVVDSHTIVITPACVEVADVDLTVVTTGTIYPDDPVDFAADISPDDFTAPYSYTVDYGDGTMPVSGSGDADPLALSHSYTAVGTYTVEIAVWNCALVEPVVDTVEVVVHEPGTCVDLAGITIAGATAGAPGVYTFTTVYTPPDATPPIAYLWDNADTTDWTVRGLDVGSHTLVVTATNCASALVTGTHTIVITQPCTEVTDVDLTVVTTGTVYPDDPVDFSADISPDDFTAPYSYTVDYGDGTAPGSGSGAADPLALSHGYTAVGTYTVEIAVWNCALAEPVVDTVVVTVYEPGTCVDLTEVTIHGATAGEPGVYTFTTSYAPAGATLPIAYLWDNGGAAETTVRDLDVGTHTLIVTATNCTDTVVVDSHTVVITAPACEPVAITGVGQDVNGCTVTLTPQLAGDPPFTYLWALGDGATSTAANPTHTYAQTGVYSATLEVWNCAETGHDAYDFTVAVDCSVPPEWRLYLPIVFK